MSSASERTDVDLLMAGLMGFGADVATAEW
jgi:hypothetical protein